MKKLIEFYGNAFVLDSIIAIRHGDHAEKTSRDKNVIITLRSQKYYIYHPGTEQWVMVSEDVCEQSIYFKLSKIAAVAFQEIKQQWEEAINVI